MRVEESRLDGNSAAGALRELFAIDTTAATATCAGCGRSAPIGALLDYGHPMGVVLRCSHCDTAVLRMAGNPRRIFVDFSGVSCLVISRPELSA
jgi:hypothetical protein